MKKVAILFSAVVLIGFTSCNKCHECHADVNGSVVYFARRYIVQKNCQIKCIPDGKVVEIKGNGVEVELEGELKRFMI